MNPNQLCQCNHNEKGMVFLRIRGGIVKPWAYGENPCVNHPLNTSVVSWGQLLLGSGGWQVFPHAHSTSRLHHFTWARDSWTLPLSPSFWPIFTQGESLSPSSCTGFFLVFPSRNELEGRPQDTISMCMFSLQIYGLHTCFPLSKNENRSFSSILGLFNVLVTSLWDGAIVVSLICGYCYFPHVVCLLWV